MIRHGAVIPLLLAVMSAAGCGSSSSEKTTKATSTPTPTTSVTPAQSAKARYAEDQSTAIGRVDTAMGEVLYLNPAATGAAVLAQKIHSLSAQARTAARAISKLTPIQGARTLQGREVTELLEYARTLDAWVKAHPKRTVGDANDVVHGGREGLDRVLDDLDRLGALG
jgi:hypothetical protein